MTRLRVGVIYGGRSSEHEVSLASAAAICSQLDSARYDVVPLLIDRSGRWSIPDRIPTTMEASTLIAQSGAPAPEAPPAGGEAHLVPHPGADTVVTIARDMSVMGQSVDRAVVRGLSLDVVFPIVHGPHGEDGTLQGLLELANVPYVGAGVLASALAMDKVMAKVHFAAHGLAVVDHAVVAGLDWEREPGAVLARLRSLALPLFVKPANLGSSIGVSKVTDAAGLGAALATAAAYDDKILVEVAVPDAREIECAVLGNHTPDVSVPGEVVPHGEFYDYHAKYVDDRSRILIPAPLSAELTAEARTMAATAYRALDCVGMARVDFLLDGVTDRLYVNEINTLPGFTTISQYAKLWAASGLPFPALLDRLIDLARERHERRRRLRTTSPNSDGG